MSDALSSARAALRDVVNFDGVRVYSVLPSRVVPPFIFVAPGEPYLDFEGTVFTGVMAHFRVGCVVTKGANDKRANDVDDLLLRALVAIDASGDFEVDTVDQPGPMTISGQTHLAAVINVTKEIHP